MSVQTCIQYRHQYYFTAHIVHQKQQYLGWKILYCRMWIFVIIVRLLLAMFCIFFLMVTLKVMIYRIWKFPNVNSSVGYVGVYQSRGLEFEPRLGLYPFWHLTKVICLSPMGVNHLCERAAGGSVWILWFYWCEKYQEPTVRCSSRRDMTIEVENGVKPK